MDGREKQTENKKFQTESSAELAPTFHRKQIGRVEEQRPFPGDSLRQVEEGIGDGRTLGIIGLVFSIISLFMLPFLLSILGIGAGYIAVRKGSSTSGKWAIGIGVLSLLATLIFAPLLLQY